MWMLILEILGQLQSSQRQSQRPLLQPSLSTDLVRPACLIEHHRSA